MKIEKIFTTINGSEQGMIMQYDDLTKPILLFLHGGPGSPSFIFFEQKILPLYKLFVICHWEQRGAGISYHKEIDAKTMNSQQLIDDAASVTHFLLEKYQREKIFLMGHSWGTFLGIQLAQQHPELFYAYIGIGQINNQLASEQAAYDYMLAAAKANHDQKDIKKLLAYDKNSPDFPSHQYLARVRSKLLNKYHIGLTHQEMSMLKIFVLPLLTSKTYTFKEKFKQIKGAAFSLSMFDEVLATNISEKIQHIKIPTYFISGKYDYQTSQLESSLLFQKLDIPDGDFILFDHSAHSPLFEEPERFLLEMEHIVNKIQHV